MFAYSSLFVLLYVGSSQAQNLDLKYLNFRQFTEKDGANPILYNSFTDKNGFTWFSSLDLKRFDGHHFKTYIGSDAGYVFGEMFEDNRGGLFVMTFHHGVLKYDAKKDSFFPFQDSIKVGQKKMRLEGNVDINSNGDVWLNGKKFIARLKNDGKKFEDITPLLKLPYLDFVSWVDIDENDQYWLSSDELGTIRIDTKSMMVTTSSNNSDNEPIFDYCLGNAFVKHDNALNLWILQFDMPHPRRYLLRYDLKTNKQYKYVFPYNTKLKLEFQETWVHNYFVDHKGTVWVRLGENVGIARYIYSEDRFEVLYTQKHDENGFEGGFFVGAPSPPLKHDPKTDNFWTASKYLMNFNPYRQRIGRISNESVIQQLFRDRYEQLEMLSDVSIRNIIQAANGKYYVSYRGLGIVRFDADWKNPKHIWFVNNKATYTSTIFSVDGKTLYFGDDDSHIYSFDISKEKVQRVVDGSFRDQYIRSVYIENDTTVWIGHIRTGLSKFNPRTRSLKHYPIELIPKNIKTESTVYKIIPHGRHHLWLGTYQKGLQLFDKRSGQVVQQWSHQGQNISHPRSGYHDVLSYGKDTLLIASHYGVIVLNLKTMVWDKITTKDDLQDDVIMQILPTGKPDVVAICSQTKGFEFLNIKTKEITFLSEEQGNEKINFRTGSIVNDKGELVLASGDQGMIIVEPSVDDKKKLDIKLTELYVNDSLYALNYENPTKALEIVMPESKNKIDAKFSVMDVWYCSSTNYFVKLEGSNTDWIKLKSPEVSYQALGAGDYKLWIKARDLSTGRSVSKHVVSLSIRAPWYKTWWFMSLMIALLGFIVYARIRQTNKLNQSKIKLSKLESANFQKQVEIEQIEKQLNEVKLAVLRAQMNPHFIFNSLNSIENYIVKNDKKAASDYLHIFSNLIRNSLDASRNELISLEKELETVNLYVRLEQMRFKNSFDFVVDIAPGIINLNPLVPPMMIQPFIENAILHGLIPSRNNDLRLILNVYKVEHFLFYKITDNGIGRKASLSYKKNISKKSEGIKITTQRLQMHNGLYFDSSDVTIIDLNENERDLGTCVILKIRIK